jgi:hypothetical protein
MCNRETNAPAILLGIKFDYISSCTGWDGSSIDHIPVRANWDIHQTSEFDRIERGAGPSFIERLEHGFPRMPCDCLNWVLIARKRHYRRVSPSYFRTAR